MIPKVVGSGRKGKNYTTFCNILQSKKCKEEGTENRGYGKWEV